MLKRQDHYWIVMTPDGGFHRIPPDSREVIEGEEIEFALPQEQRVRTVRRPWRNVTYAAAACLLLLLSGIPLWNMLFTTAYAAVSIDINPSFELEVNKQYQVTDLHALNKEAEALAPSIEWKNRELTTVTSDIIQDARQSGFLKRNQDILIVPVGLDSAEASQEVLQKIEQHASILAKQGGEGVTVTLMESTKEARQQAQKEGMSVGKYALYDSVRHMDHPFSVDQIKKLSITEISSAIGGIDRVPNTKRYTNQPARKPDATPKPAAQPEVKSMKSTVTQQTRKEAKADTRKRHPVYSKKSDHTSATQESGPKTKVIPKAVTEETKHKAEAQAKRESGRTEEEKKYKSDYGQLQQRQNQDGQGVDEDERKRNDAYKKERENKQPNFSAPFQ
ncbi:anti-sigma factor-like protein [Aneurinibacillus soli]|uniref:Anti-sigma-I factor RsgI n=1 Tax=Aneurinibacillus soli TaxID=1500254 RepID=A0A0U5ASG5_9BACL|nr:anti-sigma factor-like protein [Aneurinibacillus soli]BAU26778.1 Anti-sigma-I factor RsgI [Aneurinibacillus soli]